MSHVDVSGSTGVSRLSDSTRRLRALSGLSDRELLSHVKDLVARERAVTLEILVHLVEVERRRLHLGLGYPSMFEYCLRHLGYSSSAASRRIHSARCIRDYPEVYGLLEKNEVNLSSVSLVAPILTQENKDDLVRRIRNRSQKEVEAIVADYRPPVSLRDRARPVCVAVSGPRANSAPGLPLSEAASAPSPGGHLESSGPAGSEGTSGMAATERTSGGDHSRSGSEKRPNSAGGPPRLERKFQVQFLASERFMKKFERAKALLSNKKGTPSYEAVLEAALDEFLKDHDPEKRKQRREEREQKTEAKTKSGERDSAEGASRRIPAATRDAVFARDRGRCTFVGSTGKRCDATRNLQIDHIIPYARGGTATLDNLRLLCERHNKHEAERVLGANTVRRFCRRG
jgi:5-methylcytosine-specific restriction endonuclease McrA